MWLDNKKIMITGGTGTIGKALLNKIINLNLSHIYIFSRDEQKQDEELLKFRDNPNVSFIIGDIKNYDSINSALKNIDIVFHTAAMKIVRLCESNPYEALMTNVIGTQNVIRSAIENNVQKVIFTSSDKAANPTTVMGVGKLYSERLLCQANLIKGNTTKFSAVRFGNILGSRGCVLDLFKRQIKDQGLITITHPEMTRFICTIEEAIDFLIKSGEASVGGEIFIKKMPSIKIMDLAEVMINYMAPIYSLNPADIKIKIIGKQISEKLYEELVTVHEAERAVELEDCYCILPTIYKYNLTAYNFKSILPITKEISSNTCPYLTQSEILTFLKANNLI